MHDLPSLGWSRFFVDQDDVAAHPELTPARVAEEQRGSFRILGERGLFYAEVAGRLRHEAETVGALVPCVGDWVLARLPDDDQGVAMIHRVLARRTCFSRQAAGERTAEQVIASNIDTVFLVQSLNRNLNARRLERYLALLWESGAEPVVVLSKSDLCADPTSMIDEIRSAATGVHVHITSALADGGLDPLKPYLQPGRTVALVGSSGVGKSTIVNRLAGSELLPVNDIREDDRGRHTTTARHLVLLPGGGMLLDTPGMRTVLMWEGAKGLGQVFPDIEEMAAGCRFRDCTHATEPGCAIRRSLETGELDPARYRSYEKLQKEIRHQAMKTDVRLRIAEQDRWRRIHMAARQRPDKRKIR